MRELPFIHYAERLRTANAFRQLPPLQPASYELDKNLMSNDYLALAYDLDLRRQFWQAIDRESLALGSTGSRLMSGNYEEALELERLLAKSFGKERALLFNSGYHANVGIIASLKAMPSIHIVVDRLCHASIYDGIVLSGKPFSRFRHNDLDHLEAILQKILSKSSGPILVIAESLYSMDGDMPDLCALVELKKRYPQLLLYLDEAHAIGVRGASGLGLAEEKGVIADIDLLVGTFGKALAGMGAYLVASKAIIEYMINQSRSFIFSTMLPPLQVAWNSFVFTRLDTFTTRRSQLATIAATFRSQLASKGYPSLGESHIIPIHTHGKVASQQLAQRLNAKGYAVKAILAPTVPEGSERLRVSLTAAHSLETLSAFVDSLPNYSS